MKGIIVFNDRADISFYSLDRELRKYMFDRLRSLEEDAGAMVRREIRLLLLKLTNVHVAYILFLLYEDFPPNFVNSAP